MYQKIKDENTQEISEIKFVDEDNSNIDKPGIIKV